MSWKAVFENPIEPFAEVGTFEHEGRSFSAGGSFYDPARGILHGYPKKTDAGYVLQSWNGEPIVKLTLVSTFRGGFGREKMYSWRRVIERYRAWVKYIGTPTSRRSNPLDDATEFARRRSLPGVEVRRMSAGRSFDVYLSLLGRDIGSMHQTLKRGKVASTMYLLPPMEKR